MNTILIVEDTPANIDLLLATLGEDYSISVALDGPTSLKSVEEHIPDLILLDIMMPGMDGYEVCQRLKADPRFKDIPIIFLTAMTSDSDEEKGLLLGAVDYIFKPFNPTLVLARVRNQISLHNAKKELSKKRDEIAAAYEKLQNLEKVRDDLVHMVVHDFRSPLSSIGCFIDLLAMQEAPVMDARIEIQSIRTTIYQLCEMVSSLLDVSRMESGSLPMLPAVCDLCECAQAASLKLSGLLHDRHFTIKSPSQPITAFCDAIITERILQNLIGNALKFTPADGDIQVSFSNDEQFACVSVIDNGPGIPAEYQEKIFQKFGQAETKEHYKNGSTGLGLTFCKLAAEAQGGSIGLESRPNHGATFHLRLPLKKPHNFCA